MKNDEILTSSKFHLLGKLRMKRELTITRDPIDEKRLVTGRGRSPNMGAVIYFIGVVRGTEEGTGIEAIDYEAFEAMAERQFNLLFDEVEKRWPIESVRLVHRIGIVRVSEPSLGVEVIAPHRGEAFAACQWLIDRMKEVVPIWKKPVARSPKSRADPGNAMNEAKPSANKP